MLLLLVRHISELILQGLGEVLFGGVADTQPENFRSFKFWG